MRHKLKVVGAVDYTDPQERPFGERRMCSVMSRSFADCQGFGWPREWALKKNGIPVTWRQVHEERAKRQIRELENKRAEWNSVKKVAVCVWVFFVPGWLFGGWHLYLKGVGWKRWIRPGFGYNDDRLTLEVMKLFPCGVFPALNNFYDWAPLFAKMYARTCPHGRKQGVSFVWGTMSGGHLTGDLKPTAPA